MERAIAIRLVIHPINCDFHSVPVYSFVQMPQQQQQNSDDDGPGSEHSRITPRRRRRTMVLCK